MQLIFLICVGYVFHMEAKKRCLPPWKWSFLAVLLYIFSTLTVASLAKTIIRAFELNPVGIISLFIQMIVCIISLVPLTFINYAMKENVVKMMGPANKSQERTE